MFLEVGVQEADHPYRCRVCGRWWPVLTLVLDHEPGCYTAHGMKFLPRPRNPLN